MVSYVSIDNTFFSLTSPDDKDGSPPAKRVSRSSLTLHLHSPSWTPQGTEYEFKEDWGEQEVGIKNPVAVVLDLTTETCSVLSTGEFDDISVGQVSRARCFVSVMSLIICRLSGVQMS